jgi:hypothetical protein
MYICSILEVAPDLHHSRLLNVLTVADISISFAVYGASNTHGK